MWFKDIENPDRTAKINGRSTHKNTQSIVKVRRIHTIKEIIDPVTSPVNLSLIPTALSSFKSKRPSSLTQLAPEPTTEILQTNSSTVDLSLQGRRSGLWRSTSVAKLVAPILSRLAGAGNDKPTSNYHVVMIEGKNWISKDEAPEDAVFYSTGLYNTALEVLAQACAIDDHEVMLEISMFLLQWYRSKYLRMNKPVFVHVLSTVCTTGASKYIVDATHTLYKLSLSGFLPLQVWLRNTSYLKNFLSALEHPSEATVYKCASVFALILQAAEKSSRVSIFMLVTPKSLAQIHEALMTWHMSYKVCATLEAICIRLYKMEMKQQRRSHPRRPSGSGSFMKWVNQQRLAIAKSFKTKVLHYSDETLRSVRKTSVSQSRRMTDSYILVPTHRLSTSIRSSALRTSSTARVALTRNEAMALANIACGRGDDKNSNELLDPKGSDQQLIGSADVLPKPESLQGHDALISGPNVVLLPPIVLRDDRFKKCEPSAHPELKPGPSTSIVEYPNCQESQQNISLTTQESVRSPDDTSQGGNQSTSSGPVDHTPSLNPSEGNRLNEKPVEFCQLGPSTAALKAAVFPVGPTTSLVPPAMTASVSCPGAPVHQENRRMSSSLLLIDLLLDEPVVAEGISTRRSLSRISHFTFVKPSLLVEIDRRRKIRKNFEDLLQKAHDDEAYNNVTTEPPRSRAKSTDPITNILNAYRAATECALPDFVEVALKPVLRNYFEKRILPLLAPGDYRQHRTRRSKQWRRHSSLIKIGMRAIGIIPARLRSTRFDAKPLALICGKPMIQHTFEAASKAKKLAGLFVATDAHEIAAVVQAAGGQRAAILTDSAISSGTERVAQALKTLDESYDIVVNIQGDEPGVDAKHIDLCIEALENDERCVMSSLMAPIIDEKEARSHHIVKCVTNAQMHAMYFSRALIPASKDNQFDPTRTMKHIGLYAYRRSFLLDVFPTLPSPLGQIEDLEQLRVLEAGYNIKMVRVEHANPGVDLPEDIAKLEAILSLKQ